MRSYPYKNKWYTNAQGSKTCLKTELSPMKIGGINTGASIKACNSTWAKHILAFVFRFLGDNAEISPHSLHENCHSIGRNQKPQQ